MQLLRVSKTHLLLSLNWFQHHEKQNCVGTPVTVWEYDLFCDADVYSFIPVQHVVCKTVSLVDKLDSHSGRVLFVSLYIEFFYTRVQLYFHFCIQNE